jgi:hypothetical protein
MPVIVDNNINLDKTKEYRLSIQSNLSGFSFCITDPVVSKCLYLRKSDFSLITDGKDEYLKKCSRLVESVPMLSYKYKEVSVITDTEKYTLVPSLMVKENEILGNLSRLFTIEDDEEVSHKIFEELNLSILFAANSTFMNIIKRVQPEFDNVPSAYLVLKKLLTRKDHNKLYLSYVKGRADVAVMSGSHLFLCNSYSVAEFTSALYFALLALKQSYINPENTTVFIHGDIFVPEIQLLSKYFPMIKYFRSRKIPLGNSSLEMKYSLLTIL